MQLKLRFDTKVVTRVVTSILAVAVMLEACARIDDWLAYRAPLLSPYTVDNLYVSDGNIKRGRPHAAFKKWQLNELGLRGPDFNRDRTHILCIGASETFGMLETTGSEYPRQLEAQLNKIAGNERFEVANLSYFGLKLPTAAALVPALVDELKPKLAVIYLTYGGYIAPNSTEETADQNATRGFSPRFPSKVNDFGKSLLPMRIQTWIKKAWMVYYVGLREPIDVMPPDRAQFLTRDLSTLLAILRLHGVEPVIVTHATRFSGPHEPDRIDWLVAWRRFYPLFSAEGLLDMENKLNDVAKQVAKEHDVLLVDAASLMPGGSQYFTDHVHFTDLGAKTLAEILATQLAPKLLDIPEAKTGSGAL